METHDEEFELKIVRKNSKELVSQIANDVAVVHSSDGFFITFSQIEPPIVLTDEEKEALKSRKTVDAEAVAKIFVTPDVMKVLIRVLVENSEKREKTYGGEK